MFAILTRKKPLGSTTGWKIPQENHAYPWELVGGIYRPESWQDKPCINDPPNILESSYIKDSWFIYEVIPNSKPAPNTASASYVLVDYLGYWKANKFYPVAGKYSSGLHMLFLGV